MSELNPTPASPRTKGQHNTTSAGTPSVEQPLMENATNTERLTPGASRASRFSFHTSTPAPSSGRNSASNLRNANSSYSGRMRLNPRENGAEAAELERQMRKMMAGQNEAISEIVNVYQLHLAGLAAPQRPVGAMLFLGPTGTGKTRMVEALAESLVGSSRAVIKIDCGEFQHSHEIAKLVGSPPGYLGHRETHPLLSQETLNQYHTDRVKLSFVLFDEIEKASDALWNLLLGILDKATLTLGDNRRVDFTNTLIFLTSNLGASEMSSIMRPGLGFTPEQGALPDHESEEVMGRLKRAALEAARRKFTPEFINRLDKMIVFHPLGEDDLRRIVEIELARLQDRILTCSAAGGFVFRVTDRERARLLEDGVDARYGARHLRRTIERRIVQPLSNLIASGQVRMGDVVEIDDDGDDDAAFSLLTRGLSMQEMSEVAGPTVQPLLQLAAALGRTQVNDGPPLA